MKNWLKLIAGLCLIYAFIFLLPKLYREIGLCKAVLQTIDAKNIDTDALFYSEESHTNTAVIAIENLLQEE